MFWTISMQPEFLLLHFIGIPGCKDIMISKLEIFCELLKGKQSSSFDTGWDLSDDLLGTFKSVISCSVPLNR